MHEQLIKNRELVGDPWTSFAADTDIAELKLPPGPVVVAAELWLAHRSSLLARCSTGEKMGISLAPAFAVEALAEDIEWFSLIAVEFPKFADGRGYTTARLLRERYGYRKELRAVGDIGQDQLFLLHRVGFDAFMIPAGRDAKEALNGFLDFPEVYQAATDQTVPLFRRRAA